MAKNDLLKGAMNLAGNLFDSKDNDGFDYDDVAKILGKVKGMFGNDDFADAFGNKADDLKDLVEKAIDMIKEHVGEAKVKSAINKIKKLVDSCDGILPSTISGLLDSILK